MPMKKQCRCGGFPVVIITPGVARGYKYISPTGYPLCRFIRPERFLLFNGIALINNTY